MIGWESAVPCRASPQEIGKCRAAGFGAGSLLPPKSGFPSGCGWTPMASLTVSGLNSQHKRVGTHPIQARIPPLGSRRASPGDDFRGHRIKQESAATADHSRSRLENERYGCRAAWCRSECCDGVPRRRACSSNASWQNGDRRDHYCEVTAVAICGRVSPCTETSGILLPRARCSPRSVPCHCWRGWR